MKPLARRWHWRRKHISITSTGVIEAVSAMEVKGVNGGDDDEVDVSSRGADDWHRAGLGN